MSAAEEKFQHAVGELRGERVVLLVDDWQTPEAGYLIAAAEIISSHMMAGVITRGRGVIMAALSEERRIDLGLSLMPRRGAADAPDFTVSVEAREGVSTGICAADRARTVKLLATSRNARRDLISPGHIFPVRAAPGGVLIRAGWAEAAVDLVEHAGFVPVAVVSHLLGETGSWELPARVREPTGNDTPEWTTVRLSEVVAARLSQDSVVRREAVTRLPRVGGGSFTAYAYRSLIDDTEHLALVKGSAPYAASESDVQPILVRVQAEDPAGDLLDFSQCESRPSMESALRAIEAEGRGVFVYIRHPRRGLLAGSLARLAGNERTQADLRQYGLGAQILRDLGVERVRLLTSGKRVLEGIKAFGIQVVERIPLHGV